MNKEVAMAFQLNPFNENDQDPIETQEWLDAIKNVLDEAGPDRAHALLEGMINLLRRRGVSLPFQATTDYVNTIPPEHEPEYPGDPIMEQRIRALIRWNAMAMVVRTSRTDMDLGGHIGTFASSATLYDMGFNHFWRATTPEKHGDMLFIQGHASPGIYARSFLEGVISEDQLQNFRQEVDKKGLSSYPHPWLMPDYWQFPTVSMGLGPMQAVYQARFMKYLEARGVIEPSDRKIWCFCGDGEMDEPESTAGISIAAREKLDNLIFVINCNLQRLDGPVRGNGKIIQELEGLFRGAGWNVLKVVWGRYWDALFAKDNKGLLRARMQEAVDGDYQNYKAKGGAYTREHFFGKYPELRDMVAHMDDIDIMRLNRGGHDPFKLFAAYHNAVNTKGQPTVILAKTVKGYGLGTAGEAMNTAHNTKKMADDQVRAFRDRFRIPISDDKISEVPFYRPDPESEEMKYLKARRGALNGSLPRRVFTPKKLKVPELSAFQTFFEATGDREVSTTMVYVRILTMLVKDKEIGKRIVPVVPDEARTFGMEGLFRQLGIYSSEGQKYEPVDSDQVMFYKESKNGQILEEGINEAGAFCSWMAAATSYANHSEPMIPFYIYYSMFGFQRIGDFAWAAGDSRARGFLLGGTSGRTTLNGEGLQHQDGHSHLQAGTIPNCITYDPTFGYELAVIIQDGLRRMYQDNEDVYYYITTMNENYVQPAMPKGAEEGIRKGLYLFEKSKAKAEHRVQLLGSGTIFLEVMAAAKLLEKDFGIAADIWGATSFNELRKDALECERWNMMHPEQKAKVPYVTGMLEKTEGPVIAATDYMKLYTDQIRAYVPKTYVVMGTDGFGRSDSREKLRHHFEVNRYYIVIAALTALLRDGKVKPEVVSKAMKQYKLDPNKANPLFA